MTKKLTVKQKKFVKAYVENDGNGTKAALETYDTTDEKTASVIAAENLAKPSIRDEVDKAMVKHNITIDAAVKPIADGLHATREFYDKEGNYIESTPDHSTRLKASGMALKLLGAEQGEGKGTTIIFNQGDVVKSKYVKD